MAKILPRTRKVGRSQVSFSTASGSPRQIARSRSRGRLTLAMVPCSARRRSGAEWREAGAAVQPQGDRKKHNAQNGAPERQLLEPKRVAAGGDRREGDTRGRPRELVPGRPERPAALAVNRHHAVEC